MSFVEHRARLVELCILACTIPVEQRSQGCGKLFEHIRVGVTGECDAGASHDDILQTRDHLVLHHPGEFPGGEVVAGEGSVITLLDELPDLSRTCSVAGEKALGAVAGTREVLLDPDSTSLLGAREVAASACLLYTSPSPRDS